MAEKGHDSKTVFVKGLSYSWGKADLEEVFSNVGPVRKCFLVQERGQPRHKGCGFVHFATAEDAQQAVKALNDTLQGGRKVQVEHAQRRASFDERKKRKREQPDPPASTLDANLEALQASLGTNSGSQHTCGDGAPRLAVPKADKQRLVRTVAVGVEFLDAQGAAVNMVQSLPEVEDVVASPSPAVIRAFKLKKDKCPDTVIFAVFKTVKAALHAVVKLHKQPLGESPEVEVNTKRRRKSTQGEPQTERRLWARQVSGEGLHLKKWRLIIRNIAFNVEEEQLLELLSPAGFVWELTLPRDAEGKLRGFAFAGFTCRAHAEKAIQLCNGRVLANRPVAVDWAVAKASFQAPLALATPGALEPGLQVASSPRAPQGAFQPDEPQVPTLTEANPGEGKAELLEEGCNGKDIAAEKEMMKGVLQQLEPDAGDGASPVGKAPAAPKAKRRHAAASSPPPPGTEPPKTRDVGSAGAASPVKAAVAVRPATTAGSGAAGKLAELGDMAATVFVRGLALDALKYEVEERFARFGHVKACRLVVDRTTGRGKGTAFVEFADPKAACKAVAAGKGAKSAGGTGLAVGGQRVEVDLALAQDDARALAAQRAAGKGGTAPDKRNLYLAKEGSIAEGSAAWASMSDGDRRKRARAGAEAAAKLRSPNFAVSRTRLCLRNLPYGLDEKALRTLVLAAVQERAARARVAVKQVKILRDTGKAGPDGRPSSKGLAFVELGDHEHALCALRQLNNNPAPFGLERRPIVEFAVENVQVLKKREARRSAASGRPPRAGALDPQLEPPGAKADWKRPKVEGAVAAAGSSSEAARAGGEEADDLRAAKRRRPDFTKALEATGAMRAAAKGPKARHAAHPSGQGTQNGSAGRQAAARGPKPARAAKGEPQLKRHSRRQAKQSPAPMREVAEAAGQLQAQRGKRQKAQSQSAPPHATQAAPKPQHKPQNLQKSQKPWRPQPGAKQGMRRKGAGDIEDRLDTLVKDYTKRYFGPENAAGSQPSRKAAITRWFA